MEIAIGRWYKHYKGGEYYIRDIVLRENDLEQMVVYSNFDNTYVRPLSEFKEKFKPVNYMSIKEQDLISLKVFLKEYDLMSAFRDWFNCNAEENEVTFADIVEKLNEKTNSSITGAN